MGLDNHLLGVAGLAGNLGSNPSDRTLASLIPGMKVRLSIQASISVPESAAQ